MAEDDEAGAQRTGDGVATDAAAAKKSLIKKLLPYIAGGAVSIALGIGAGVVTRKPANGEGGKTPKSQGAALDQFPDKLNIDLPELIFNCADTGQNVAGKVSIVLEVRTTEKFSKTDKKSVLQALIEQPDGAYYSRIRDALIRHFSGKVSTDLKTARGKEIVGLEVQDQMNRIIFSGTGGEDPKGIVTGVLFTTFLVQ